jgi:hypothetical protein
MKKNGLPRFSGITLLSCCICLTAAIQTQAQTPAVTIHSDLPAKTGIKQIVHGNGIFLANLSTAFYTSTNGVTWKQVPGPALHGSPYNAPTLAFGAGNFVCVGDSGAISTSPDGQSWTVRSSGTTAYLRDVKFLQRDFYAVGDSAGFLHSGNGSHWHALDIGKGAVGDRYNSVDFGNGYFVINAINPDIYPVIYRSGADTLGNWTADTLTSPTQVFFLKHYFYRIDTRIQTSTDAATWTPIPYFSSSTRKVDGGFYDSSNIYLVSSNYDFRDPVDGSIFPSADGLNFSSAINTTIRVAGGLYARQHDYIFGGTGAERSSDGIHYDMLGMNFQNAAFHDSTTVGVGYLNNQGLIRRSTDFVTWKDKTPDSALSLSAVVYDGSRYVAVAFGAYNPAIVNNGSVYTSPHGVNWTRVSATSPSLSSLAYGAGRYVASGLDANPVFLGQAALYSSTDAVTWTSVYSGDRMLGKYVSRVKYLNGHFFAIGQAPNNTLATFLLISDNGVTWSDISPNLPYYLNSLDDLVYDGSKYTLMGTEEDNQYYPIGFFCVSTTDVNDPNSWGNKGAITSPPAGSILASGVSAQTFAYSHGHYVGGASDMNNFDKGYLIYSNDAIHWDYLPLGVVTGIVAADTAGSAFRMVGYGNVWLTVSFPTTGTSSSADTLPGLAVSPALAQDPRFRVYPNPAAGNTTVVLPETGAAIAVLYNAAGEAVVKKVFNDQTVTLPLQGLPAGVYHLTVRQNGRQYTRAILHP